MPSTDAILTETASTLPWHDRFTIHAMPTILPDGLLSVRRQERRSPHRKPLCDGSGFGLIDWRDMSRSIALTFALVAGIGGGMYAQSGAVPRDGFEMHYRLNGSGTPIVFLAGGPGLDVDYFEDAAKLFPVGYQRVFLEQRGTGKSRPHQLDSDNMSLRLVVEDLEALRKQLGLEKLMLAGHSWGGMLAMAYAASHPDRVDRLILIGSGGPTREFFEWYSDNIDARLHSEDKEARTYWDDAAKRGVDRDKAGLESIKAIFPAFFFDRAKGLSFAAAKPDGSYHTDTNTLMLADIEKAYDLRAGLTHVTTPVLIIQGRQDPTGDSTAEEIHALLSASVIRYINQCGHFPWIEQPEKFKQIIAEFLAPSGHVKVPDNAPPGN